MGGAKSTSTASSSLKRKKGPPAFYAVKVGHQPGLYYSWDDTRQQTEGFKNSVFQRFDTLPEAEAFLSSDTRSTPKPSKGKFYGVKAGHVPGVYTEWHQVQQQITGFKGSKQKAFSTQEEALAYVHAGKTATPSEASAPISLKGHLDSSAPSIADSRKQPSKKQRKNDGTPVATATDRDYEPGTGPLPSDAEDGYDRTIVLRPDGKLERKSEAELNALKKQPNGDFEGELKIWTDGAAKGNGRVGALAGIGIWFGPDDARNVSEPLLAEGKQTNQRAELAAISRAIDIAPIDRSVRIFTDSYYSIKCLTEWFQKWEQNDWKNSGGKLVENKDIIEPIIARIREREIAGASTKFCWIKGHGIDVGNIGADHLATAGAVMDRDAVRALANGGAEQGQAEIEKVLTGAGEES